MKVYELIQKLAEAPAGADVMIMGPYSPSKERVAYKMGYTDSDVDSSLFTIYTGDKDE